MQADHGDIVRAVAAQFPVVNTSTDTILPFVLHVLAALPADEKAGLLAKPGGENVANYNPLPSGPGTGPGISVSISRVCYPNGTIYKILSDAGPGGTNGPGWSANGEVDPQLYVPFKGGTIVTPPQPPRVVPYDEVDVIAFQFDVNRQYVAAGRTVDFGNVVWAARMQFDAVTMGYDASRAKHLAELRAALGL